MINNHAANESEFQKEKLIKWIRLHGIQNPELFASSFPSLNFSKIKQKWLQVWNPQIKKGNWTQDEDFLFFKYFLRFPGMWSRIADFLDSRTRISVSNRFKNSFRTKAFRDALEFFKKFIFQKKVEDFGKICLWLYALIYFFADL